MVKVTTISCPPGNHPIDFTYRVAHWAVCSPDVPGDGLPMDLLTLACLIGTFGLFGIFILYLAYLTRADWKTEKQVKGARHGLVVRR